MPPVRVSSSVAPLSESSPAPPVIRLSRALTALIAYFKSACHMSFSSIRKFLRDCVGLTLSRGMV